MVPIQGTLDWLKRYRSDFGASIKKGWKPWLVDGKDFGGMVWELDGITFWSVVGAGHMVPTDKPK
jgi:carboxypeptidase C (cathepsin A)